MVIIMPRTLAKLRNTLLLKLLSAELHIPEAENWWRAVDECRSIFQIDSENHGSTLPLETSDRMVSGLPLHAYDSENRATLI